MILAGEMNMKLIYLDYAATTPVREEVVEVMLPYFSNEFANASSFHLPGQRARKAVENARKSTANVIGADSREIIFTSGGTESINLAIKGVAHASRDKGKHIVTSSIEHSAVLNCCGYLEQEGFEVSYLPVDGQGLVSPDSVKKALRSDTVLVSVMLANNEVGTVQPIKEVGEIARDKGIPCHTDATQALGKIPVRAGDLNVDLLSISGHKIYGPKGIGVLYASKETPIVPLMHGGRHEMGYRPGTQNVPAIVGMAMAVELAEKERDEFREKMKDLRFIFEKGIKERIEDVQLNGHPEKRLPNISNVSFRFVEGESLLLSLDTKGIAVSTGSACSSGDSEPSHVLMAMGISPDLAAGSLRISMGRLNEKDDISYVLDVLPDIVEKLREISPMYRKQMEVE
jgi:cysteine desulfurase